MGGGRITARDFRGLRTMTVFEALQSTGLPCAYSHFEKFRKPPYIVYMGDGQDTMTADDTIYWSNNRYQIEYYFTAKNEEAETAIEQALLSAGYIYEKTDDIYLEDEEVYLIYYYI